MIESLMQPASFTLSTSLEPYTDDAITQGDEWQSPEARPYPSPLGSS